MQPVLFRVPFINWDVPGYGLMLMLGFMLAVIWAVRRAVRSGANPDVILNCAFICLIGGVVGSRIMYVVHYWDERFAIFDSPIAVVMAIVDVRQGGLEVYGGFIAAALGTLLYLVLWKHSIRWYLDIMAPSAALGMGIGRIGCFLNGCCWGGVCDLPWAVQFPYGSPPAVSQWHKAQPGAEVPQELLMFTESGMFVSGRPAELLPRELMWASPRDLEQGAQLEAWKRELANAENAAERNRVRRNLPVSGCNLARAQSNAAVYESLERHGLTLDKLQTLAKQYPSLPIHPTQLYSAGTLIVLALFLNAFYWRRSRDGQVICLMLLIEPVSRYMIEVIRADNPTDTLGTFTVSQFLAGLLTLIGLVGLLLLRSQPPRSPRARIWEPEAEDGKPSQRAAKA